MVKHYPPPFTSALLVLAAVAMLAPARAQAGSLSASASATATVNVVAPLVLSHPQNAVLSFGTIIAGKQQGTIQVTPSGTSGTATAKITGGVKVINSAGVSADPFSLSGQAAYHVALGLTSSGTLTGKTTGKTMSFTLMLPGATAANGAGAVTLDANGNAVFAVGGTLTVTGTEPADSYTGSYTIMATYQ